MLKNRDKTFQFIANSTVPLFPFVLILFGKRRFLPKIFPKRFLSTTRLKTKNELMLTRRAKAYSSSCLQIALAYLLLVHRNSLLKCPEQPKIAKKTTKPLIFGVQGLSKSSMLIASKNPYYGPQSSQFRRTQTCLERP